MPETLPAPWLSLRAASLRSPAHSRCYIAQNRACLVTGHFHGDGFWNARADEVANRSPSEVMRDVFGFNFGNDWLPLLLPLFIYDDLAHLVRFHVHFTGQSGFITGTMPPLVKRTNMFQNTRGSLNVLWLVCKGRNELEKSLAANASLWIGRRSVR
jgi:hypothetical protein